LPLTHTIQMKKLTLLLVACALSITSFTQVKISEGGGTPDASSLLDLESDSKGFLPPRMSTVERDLISNPAEGLVIYNTTTMCLNYRNFDQWLELCGTCAPQPTTANAGNDQIGLSGTTATLAANTPVNGNGAWSIVSGEGGSFSGQPTSTNPSATFSGVEGNSYVLRWTITTSCGSSQDDVTISFANPFTCGSSTVTFTYNGSSVTYGTVLGGSGRCWFDRNLGATSVATSGTDRFAYGDLFQWGRTADGHQRITWSSSTAGSLQQSTTTTLAPNGSQPANSNYIISSASPYDWNQNNAWVDRWTVSGNKSAADPCPTGWRVPIESEWNGERTTWSQQNGNGAFASPLKLPLSGQVNPANGAVVSAGNAGLYWSSTISSNGVDSRHLDFGSSYAVMTDWRRAGGYSIRCIRE